MPTRTEEDYIKAIYKLAEKEKSNVNTNAIAGMLNTSAASVTDMLKKLKAKGFINYKKYKGVTLTPDGNRIATKLIRKHRLWEYFLVYKLKFTWDQVHDIAEELEHIQSEELVSRLDHFLDNPKFDPHGDPIPNAEGKFTIRNQHLLSDLFPGETGIVIGIKESNDDFLRFLSGEKIKLGSELTIGKIIHYDQSVEVIIDQGNNVRLGQSVVNNILVRKKILSYE